MQLDGCMTCRTNLTEDQKRNQSRGQARIKDQSKQGVGRLWACRPMLDARERGVQHRLERNKGKKSIQKANKKMGTCIWATGDKLRADIQAREA